LTRPFQEGLKLRLGVALPSNGDEIRQIPYGWVWLVNRVTQLSLPVRRERWCRDAWQQGEQQRTADHEAGKVPKNTFAREKESGHI
jgi:hypothetical protein